MYKYKGDNKIKGVSPCPMGRLDDELVDCYWFGKVTLLDCNDCKYQKKNKIMIKK